jgi:hypothetical protein
LSQRETATEGVAHGTPRVRQVASWSGYSRAFLR